MQGPVASGLKPTGHPTVRISWRLTIIPVDNLPTATRVHSYLYSIFCMGAARKLLQCSKLPNTIASGVARLVVPLRLLALLLLLPGAGCAGPHWCDSSAYLLLDSLQASSPHELQCVGPTEFILPPDVSLHDGVTEDEAIATAMSNNSAFQALLTQMGMVEGDLVQAHMLTNPSFVTMIPVGVKQWEWTLYAPMEALLLRPQRVALAGGQYEIMAHSLMQNGLTLVRDVRLAHADLALALAKQELALEGVHIRESIAEITNKRLERGDISELEAMTARIDALNAKAQAAMLEQDVVIARSQLALLMGLPPEDTSLTATLAAPPPVNLPESNLLLEEAWASRPDLQAAQWVVNTAVQRTKLSKWQWLRIDTVADANGKGEKGFEIGPGFRFDIPIFNRNQGGVMRAQAELTQAQHNLDAIHDQIVKEVRTAAAQWIQANQQLAILQREVVPSLHEARHIAERGFENGGTDYLLVLQTTTQYVDARSRVLDQIAALRRARAELERSIGTKLPTQLPEQNEQWLLPLPIGEHAAGMPEEIQ